MAIDTEIHDFVRPEERDDYSQMVAGLRAQLNPEGALEEVFVAAIIGATWRLRQSIAELRRIQTQKTIRFEIFGPDDTSDPDLTNFSEVRTFLTNHDRGKLLTHKLDGVGPAALAAELGSICKTPRNVPCPCGSGRKHKRCCGQSAPPVLQRAA